MRAIPITGIQASRTRRARASINPRVAERAVRSSLVGGYSIFEICRGAWLRSFDSLPAVRFRYFLDPLFLIGCACYAINRWLLKPRVHSEFLQYWFNDFLLIPCALPVVLWLFRWLRLRGQDDPPRLGELAWILTVWSVLFEWAGPKFVSRATGDWRDVVMYWTGGLLAWTFWRINSATGLSDEL